MTKIIIFILLIAPAFTTAAPTAKNKADIYQTIAGELLKDCTGAGKAVAVAGFSYSDGRDSRDGGVVAERITTELVKSKKFKVIERKEIEKVFEELKLQRSGAINPDSAKEIGQMLGADWVVVGTLTELPDKQLELNTRLVSVESGEIINAAKTQIKKDWLDQYKKLLEEQNKVIKKNSKDAQAFYERGTMYADLGQYDNAIGSFGIAISIDPTHLMAYFGRGNVYYAKRDFDKVIEDFSKAIAIDPKFTGAYYERGLAYNEKGEYNKGIEDFLRVILDVPKNAGAHSALGSIYASKREYDKAIKEHSVALEIDPKDAGEYSNRGGAYVQNGELDKGIEDFSKAIEIDPREATIYTNRGIAYSQKREWAEAIEDFSMAILINPKDAYSYAFRGHMYQGKGECSKALDDVNKAIAINPNLAEAYMYRGRNSLCGKGVGSILERAEVVKAIEDFNTAVKLDSKLYTELQALVDALKWPGLSKPTSK
ncbi:MAG: hypothetical protein A2021_01570 [Elusimicrobia bacterium GWF2_52_66]|nr:MAG: hypothetical protein A2X33_08850 [Elusimicrobia bacterium GWA2_51_34]OGR86094.1 MAG: hypothetical protein A2021_01570 [Elusimicrobia bacterium GWF2_52_66]HAF96067.1 hypothetical protein [Elusimicrobiota bacterium]HCE98675.1 hypothetical protein [Elusimicrobiota bacterium]